jgi:NADPH-dependent 2,4-dienoyl-CoA reductase/sulfur reductase-like enzyme
VARVFVPRLPRDTPQYIIDGKDDGGTSRILESFSSFNMATKTQEHSNAAAYQRSLKELPEPNLTVDQEKYDVVIIGAGPAGLFSGAALARFGWNVLVVDNRSEPTIAGRAGTLFIGIVHGRWSTASHDRGP